MNSPICKNWNVKVAIVDSRAIPQVCWLQGGLKVPVTLALLPQQRVNWRIPQFKNYPKGLVTDVNSDGVTLVFPFTTEEDAKDKKTGKFLTFDEIVDLFKLYEPNLRETHREVR